MRRTTFIICIVLMHSVLSCQKNEWKEISEDTSQKIVYENSNKRLEDSDSLSINIFRFDRDEKINLNDKSKIRALNYKVVFKDFRNQYDFKVNKKSEYLIKIQTKFENYEYEIFLKDSIIESEISEIQTYLNENFKLADVVFMSKEETKKIANKELDIENSKLFENSIYPAIFEIKSENKIDTKKIEEKFPEIIDEIVSINEDLGIIILQVKT